MLWRTSEITGYDIQATDDAIGSVDDLLVDDETWAVRWLVVDTGSWLPGRKVLLPPSCLGRPNAETGQFPVEMKRRSEEHTYELQSLMRITYAVIGLKKTKTQSKLHKMRS